MTHEKSAHPFTRLTPDFILNAIESIGLWPDARIYPLNSYENRVYQIGIEQSSPIVAKFYRPDRWQAEQLRQEHMALQHLLQQGVNVVAPLTLQGQTLHNYNGFYFCVYARLLGRSPDADNFDHLFETGELIGLTHAALFDCSLSQRRTLTPLHTMQESVDICLNSDLMLRDFKTRYEKISTSLQQKAKLDMTQYWPDLIAIHGDCHRSNLLIVDDRLTLLDFDDCMMGIAVQDIWLHLSGSLTQQRQQLSELIEGYETVQPFDYRQINLIDTLKAMRMLQYSAWILSRWKDPAFPKAFPWFASEAYWIEHLHQLEECQQQWGQLSSA